VAQRDLFADLFDVPWDPYHIAADEVLQFDIDSQRKVPQPSTLTPGVARGPLVGGNLTVLHALMGTPFEIETDGHILLLEDIGEAPYRVDRMLSTMRLAGKLDRLRGVVLGTFTRRESEDLSADEGTIDSVLDDYFGALGVPVVKNFPIGHTSHNATLPIGGIVELDATQRVIEVIETTPRPSDAQ
jgi:muramoyltetrapeptide carboxypeptidase